MAHIKQQTPSTSGMEGFPNVRRDRVTLILVGVLTSVVLLALLLPIIYALFFRCPEAALGGILWGLALFAIGLLVGFLFGVPKSSREQAVVSMETTTDDANGRSIVIPSLRANTNLEDISDWLSKIIVGTGLVELKDSPKYLRQLAKLISGTLCPEGNVGLSIGAAIALVFPALGFLIGFLITRVWLQGEFRRSDQDLGQALSELKKEVGDATKAAKLALGVPREQIEAQNQAAPSLWDLDPHKDAFGGSPKNNGRELSAVITPLLSGLTTCKVSLEVRSTDPTRPLVETVTFYLHPTYHENEITQPVDSDGVARLTIHADAPFTVGASADGGATRLELDLAYVKGGTSEFYANA